MPLLGIKVRNCRRACWQPTGGYTMGWIVLGTEPDGTPVTNKGQVTLSDEQLRAIARALNIPEADIERMISGKTRSIYIYRGKGKGDKGGGSSSS
jgi:hypothetical protein